MVFLDGTSQSMLSPSTKKPVPAHHLHSTFPFELQVSHATGVGCCIEDEAEDVRKAEDKHKGIFGTITLPHY